MSMTRDVVLLGVLTLLATPLAGQLQRPWQIIPGFGVGDAFRDREAQVVASVHFNRLDTGPAVVIYIRSGEESFRCFDYFDSNLRSTGGLCSRWIGYSKPSKASDASVNRVYRLYRSSVAIRDARLHVATFDSEDGDEYNRENCDITRGLFMSQGGVTVDYWCELVEQ